MEPLIRIASLVVLYHPNPDFINNIRSYADDTDALIVVDNSAQQFPDLAVLAGEYGAKFHLIRPGKNRGIAWALNEGTKKAMETGANWVLSMDQDSCFSKKAISAYLEKIPELVRNQIFIAGPNHDAEVNALDPSMEEVDSVITSGCLFSTEVFKQTGGFDERLFIDEVDHEFCYHAKSLGFKIVKCRDIVLQHQLGESKWVSAPILGKSKRVFHHPRRLYFMLRNGLYVGQKYGTLFPASINRNKKDLFHRIKNQLLFGKGKWETLKMLAKGYRDYRKENFGNPFSSFSK